MVKKMLLPAVTVFSLILLAVFAHAFTDKRIEADVDRVIDVKTGKYPNPTLDSL